MKKFTKEQKIKFAEALASVQCAMKMLEDVENFTSSMLPLETMEVLKETEEQLKKDSEGVLIYHCPVCGA